MSPLVDAKLANGARMASLTAEAPPARTASHRALIVGPERRRREGFRGPVLAETAVVLPWTARSRPNLAPIEPEEVRCVAAPIRDPQGEIVASVGISSPLTRLHTRGGARPAAEVRKTARAITASLAS
jgi:hypothetical protein